jgi:hypothetical protein
MFRPALGSVRFTGSGVPIGMPGRTNFNRSGRELGLQSPAFWGGEIGLGYRQTYFGVTVSGFFAGNTSADATPTNAPAAAQGGASDVTAFGGAIELYGAVPLGRVTVSAGAVAGLRGFSMPLVGFEPTVCTSSGRRGRRTYPCAETATTMAEPYVQPRLRLDVALDDARAFFLGGYVGLDALGDRSVLGGVLLGIRFSGDGS